MKKIGGNFYGREGKLYLKKHGDWGTCQEREVKWEKEVQGRAVKKGTKARKNVAIEEERKQFVKGKGKEAD